ncbi:hypothetical protein [Dyadobacter pollutisoli]|uniref:Fibronectin type-III domain-containing protein n=1 Tax=Dyadobacter pollutisoli TaxID=2910158 RepID=A0A9E8SJ85_9BACT|nr:hypothetical protein [Dyadobacter pollutisoli]WAC10623.1 hypothetical protein ON006_23110 [Dyadobacter pollutisoli]
MNVPFDKRTYLFTKNVTEASGVANLGGLHNVSPLGNYGTIMHEFGHNFGSPHTHSCFWPGGPIDYCTSPEGGCYDKSLNQLDNGSLMSYCGDEHTFHPLCQTVMRTHAESTLKKAETAAPAIDALKDMTTNKGDFYSWAAVPTALSYEINYADNSGFQGAASLNLPVNLLSTKILVANKDYYIRIRAVNAFGNSAWSEVRVIKVIPKELGPPDILTQSQGGKVIPPRAGLDLTFSTAERATDYEIEVAHAFDVGFTNLTASFIVQQTNLYYVPPYGASFRWRVRAMQGEKRGAWSEVASFSANPAKNDRLFMPIPNNLQNVPLSFPFSFHPIGRYSDVTVTVANNLEMANPVFKKTYHYYELFTGFIKNLPSK